MKKAGDNIVYTESGIPVKIRKKMGIGLIIASFFFLFNPDITVIDLLPDAIGYMLICFGLSQLMFVNPSFEEAGAKFKKMVFVSIGKMASILILFGLFNEKERPYGFLLFAFAFLVLDLVFLLPAVKSLFEGFIYLAGRGNSEVAYMRKKARDIIKNTDLDALHYKERESLLARQERINARAARRKTYIEKIYRLSVIFFVVKAVGYALPEFIVLTKDEYIDGSFVMYMYENISRYRILAALTVFIFGIVWLCRATRFFVRLGKETAFIDGLKEIFVSKALPREGLFIKKSIKNAILMFCLGAIFEMDFHVSVTLDSLTSANITLNEITINLIPDVIAAAFFLAGALILRNYLKTNKNLIIASSAYAFFSLVASVLKICFLTAYGSYSAVDHIYDAYNLFFVICASTVLENIAFVVMIFMFSKLMTELIDNYTGYIPSIEDHTTKGLLDSMHRELRTKIWFVVGCAVLCASFSPVYDFMLVERHAFAQISWAIDFAAQALYAGVMIYALVETNDEVNSRYLLS